MKKIAFADFWGTFRAETFKITEFIREMDEVEITDMEHADYVFFGVHGNSHWQAPDRCVKIFFTIENAVPDFNACDYAIGFHWLQFEDRYLRLPLYYLYPNVCELMESKHKQPLDAVMAEKTDFCSMTITNDHRHPIFKELFEKLSDYKQVHSGGLWRNNTGGRVPDKLAFDRAHKFSIACENSASSGYTTEKMVQAFAANCVPIYWGDPCVAKVFNKKSFIDVSDFPSVEAVVDYVRKVDADDALYRQMLQEPALADETYAKEPQIEQLKAFLAHIFSQPLEAAYRRNRYLWGDNYIKERRKQTNNPLYVLSDRYHLWVYKTKQRLKKQLLQRGPQKVFPALPTQ